VAFVGEIKPVPKEEVAAARETYLAKHPGHFWVRALLCWVGGVAHTFQYSFSHVRAS
jgi:hypothetical protein